MPKQACGRRAWWASWWARCCCWACATRPSPAASRPLRLSLSRRRPTAGARGVPPLLQLVIRLHTHAAPAVPPQLLLAPKAGQPWLQDVSSDGERQILSDAKAKGTEKSWHCYPKSEWHLDASQLLLSGCVAWVARSEAPKEGLLSMLLNNVLKNPFIWGMALTYFFVYVVRQGVTSWFVFYLIKARPRSPLCPARCASFIAYSIVALASKQGT